MQQLKELVVGGQTETGVTLEQDVLRCASGLAGLGSQAGECIAILLRNSREQLIATLAAQHLGAYPVQMNWHSQSAELLYVLRDCGAKVLVAHEDLLAAFSDEDLAGRHVLAVKPNPELLASYRIPDGSGKLPAGAIPWSAWLQDQPPWTHAPAPAVESIIYTSGTTGNPKGVRRFAASQQQRDMTEVMRSRVFGIGAGDRVLVPAPIYHTAPHLFAIRATRKAESLVLPSRFESIAFMRDIERHRITHVYVVPTIFVRLLSLPEDVRNQYDLSSLRFVLHAGGPCAPSVKQAMIHWWGPIINEYYGSTEAGPTTFCTSEDSLSRPGTVGRAAPGVHVEIHDDKGQLLPAGQVGEVCARNDGYADFTYLHRDADRRALQRGSLLTSGDLGYLDEDGYLFLCDRKRDLVISGGVNIYPAEIEAAIMEMPDVADCVVFGIPDEEFSEALAALIQPHEGRALQADSVAKHLRARLAAFKLPRIIELRDRLPRDESGKIKKRLLREPYWQQAGRRI